MLVRLPRNFPFFPGLAQESVELAAQPVQVGLPALVDDVDFGVVGDGLEGDVGHALVDEALADVAAGLVQGSAFWPVRSASLPDAFGRVGQEVVGVAGGHEAGAGQGEGDAGGVDGDPAPAPLLGDVGGGAGAAGGVEDQVAGVGGHEENARTCSGWRVASSALPSFTSRLRVLTCQLEPNLIP